MSFKLVSSVLVALLAASTYGQTQTDCDPTKKSCPNNPALSSSYYSHDFTTGPDKDNWVSYAGDIDYTDAGAVFTIDKEGISPTIKSNFYIFFGSVSFIMRSAPGAGIVSSAILQSEDLDEVDWEWLGGVTDSVQSNYFGKGNTTSYDRMKVIGAPSCQTTTHNYTIAWTASSITWLVDSVPQRTLKYSDALGGENFPQTPMNVRIGIWAGGAPGQPKGTVEWSGGPTDFSKAPFSMVLEKIEIVNANPGKEYVWTDRSGSWESIKIDGKSGASRGNEVTVSSSVSPSMSSTASSSSATSSSASGDSKTDATTTSASGPEQSKSVDQKVADNPNAGGRVEVGRMGFWSVGAVMLAAVVKFL